MKKVVLLRWDVLFLLPSCEEMIKFGMTERKKCFNILKLSHIFNVDDEM